MNSLLLRLLTPVARLCVARGIVFRDVSEALKLAFVTAASEAGATTDSAISVRTGLQRRDICRLRAMPEDADGERNSLARLVAIWNADAAYCDDHGARVLPRMGAAPSFESLAGRVRKDVHARAMLDALVSSGVVQIEGEDVRLLQARFQPAAGSAAQMEMLGDNLGDHGAAAVDNVLGRAGPFFDRALHYNGLSDADVAALSARFEAGQMALLQDMAEEAAERAESGEGAWRVRFGGYGYWEEV